MRSASSMGRAHRAMLWSACVGLNLLVALGGCGGEEPEETVVGVRQEAITTTTLASLVGTSTSGLSTQDPIQRKAFFGAGRHWVFYSDGTNLVFQSSADLKTWSSKTTVKGLASGQGASVWSDGKVVHVA